MGLPFIRSIFSKYEIIEEDDCSYIWEIPSAERCDWVKQTSSCTSNAHLQYATMLFCTFSSDNPFLFSLGLAILIVWLLYLFLILGTTADSFFCPSLAVLAEIFHLSDNIAGVTILAFGNGAPDIFTSLVADDEDTVIMFTELIGAGLFVTAIIAGSISMINPFRIYLKSFIRDSCFYIISVCWIQYIVRDEKVHLWEALSLIAIYILFLVIVILMQIFDAKASHRKYRIPNVKDATILQTYIANRDTYVLPQLPLRSRAISLQTKLDVAIAAEMNRTRRYREENSREQESTSVKSIRPKGLFAEFFFDINPIDINEWKSARVFMKSILIIRAPFMLLLQLLIPVVNQVSMKRGWSKLLNCLQLWITPVVAFFVLRIWRKKIGPVYVLLLPLISGAVAAVVVFRTTSANRVPKYHNVLAFVGFLSAMMIVYFVAKEVMAVLQCIGYASGISDAMLGMTFLAWGNSIGDLISNVVIAKQGFPHMGFAACFGGPMFNTLLGMGLSYSIAAVDEPRYAIKVRTSEMSPTCITFLICSLVSSLVYLITTASIARRSYGFLLFSIYFIFLLINILSEIHYIHPFGTDHRDE